MFTIKFGDKIVKAQWVPTGEEVELGTNVEGLGVAFDTWGGAECSTAFSQEIRPEEADALRETYIAQSE